MKVIFSDRAYAAILAETTEKITTETGGVFLGAVVHDQWYVIEAIDPGPKSIFQIAYFEYDREYIEHLINKVANLYDTKLSPIGLWHRHPGSFDQFSSTDDGTNRKYAQMRPEGGISALVNVDPRFRITVYHVAQPCSYSVIEYEVGNHLIPDEFLQYKKPERFEKIMRNILENAVGEKSFTKKKSKISLYDFMKRIYPYLKKCKLELAPNNDEGVVERILDEIIEDVTYMTDVCGVSMSMSQKGSYICMSDENNQDRKLKLYFMYVKDRDSVFFVLGENCFKYTRNIFSKAFEEAKEQSLANGKECVYQFPSFFTDTIKKIIKRTMNGDEG